MQWESASNQHLKNPQSAAKQRGRERKGPPKIIRKFLGPAPLQKCAGDFRCVDFGGFCCGDFPGGSFLGACSPQK